MQELQCKRCGETFSRYPSDIKNGRGINCSRLCASLSFSVQRMTRENAIHLSDGSWALVSPVDHDLSYSLWTRHTGGYALRRKDSINQKLHRIVMERMLGRPLRTEEKVDHLDRDPLNNRRPNLRVATNIQNAANSGPRNGRKWKGVTRIREGVWTSHINISQKGYNLGHFGSEIEAANMYDQFALELHGDFAYTNFDYK